MIAGTNAFQSNIVTAAIAAIAAAKNTPCQKCLAFFIFASPYLIDYQLNGACVASFYASPAAHAIQRIFHPGITIRVIPHIQYPPPAYRYARFTSHTLFLVNRQRYDLSSSIKHLKLDLE
jgi:hypothetical protein